MSSRQQCVRYPGRHQLGQRCLPASNWYDSPLTINQERDILPPAICMIAWWPSTRKEMPSRQQCVRQPYGHQLRKRCPSARNQCVRQFDGRLLGKGCLPTSNVYDSLVAIYQERDALMPPMCTIPWQPSIRKVKSSRQQCVRQPVGHQPGKRCPPASNVFDSLVAINQETDVFPPAMYTIACGHQLGK